MLQKISESIVIQSEKHLKIWSLSCCLGIRSSFGLLCQMNQSQCWGFCNFGLKFFYLRFKVLALFERQILPNFVEVLKAMFLLKYTLLLDTRIFVSFNSFSKIRSNANALDSEMKWENLFWLLNVLIFTIWQTERNIYKL